VKKLIIISFLFFIQGYGFGQDSKYKKLKINSNGILSNDTIILNMKFTYKACTKNGNLIALGNTDKKKKKAEGHWVFLDENGEVEVIGNYKKGKMHGDWSYGGCCFDTFKNGKRKSRKCALF